MNVIRADPILTDYLICWMDGKRKVLRIPQDMAEIVWKISGYKKWAEIHLKDLRITGIFNDLL